MNHSESTTSNKTNEADFQSYTTFETQDELTLTIYRLTSIVLKNKIQQMIDSEVLDATYDSLETLIELSYFEAESDNLFTNYNFFISEPAGWLIDLYSHLIEQSDTNLSAYPKELWVNLIGQTDILRFKAAHFDQMALDVERYFDPEATHTLNTHQQFCRSLYVSAEVSFADAKTIVSQYQKSYVELTDIVGTKPVLFDPLLFQILLKSGDDPLEIEVDYLEYKRNRNPWKENSFKTEISSHTTIDTVMILSQEDMNTCFHPLVTNYRNDRAWVKDATSAKTLVITPYGIANLCSNNEKLVSNSGHELFHFYVLKNFVSEESGISAQYLFPRWLKEGIANNFINIQRGRRQDGFKPEWLEYYFKHPPKTAQEIMNNPHEHYMRYTMLTYFLLSCCASAVKGTDDLLLPSVDHQKTDWLTLLVMLQNIFAKLNVRRFGTDHQNQIAEDMFDSFFRKHGNNGWEHMSFKKVLSLFDRFQSETAEAYFQSPEEDVCLPFSLNDESTDSLQHLRKMQIYDDALLPYTDSEICNDLYRGSPASGLRKIIENMEYFEKPGWTQLPPACRNGLKRAVLDLVIIQKDMKYWAESKRNTLEQYFISHILHTVMVLNKLYDIPEAFPVSHLVYLIEDIQVFIYLCENYEQIAKNDNSNYHLDSRFPFTRNVFISPGIDPNIAQVFIKQYQSAYWDVVNAFLRCHPVYINLFSDPEALYAHMPIQDMFLPDNYDRITYGQDVIDGVIELVKWDSFILLDQKEYKKMFTYHIREALNPGFFVRDSTLNKTLVVTPKGIVGLGENLKKLLSNSVHEYIHRILRNILTFGEARISFNFIAPKWLSEGLANIILYHQRGRHDDGFQSEQLELIEKEGIPDADEIMTNTDLNYIYYSLFSYFLLCVVTSYLDHDLHIHLLDRDDQLASFFRTLSIIQPIVESLRIPQGQDIPNQVANDLFHHLFSLAATHDSPVINMDICKKIFNAHKEEIGHAYFYPDDDHDISFDL